MMGHSFSLLARVIQSEIFAPGKLDVGANVSIITLVKDKK